MYNYIYVYLYIYMRYYYYLCSALHFSAVLPVEGFDTETIVSPVKLVSFRFS